VRKICVAYESGVGFGAAPGDLQRLNPFMPGTDEFEAWAIGYGEGAKRAENWRPLMNIEDEPDDAERLRETVFMMVSHCEERAKGWDATKGRDYTDCEFGARHEARAISAQLREIASRGLVPNKE